MPEGRSREFSARRRALLRALVAAGCAGIAPRGWTDAAPVLRNGRLIVVFLRGAYDGLSATIPYADPDYARHRPNIAIPAPDASAATACRLDRTFALHPALAALLPMWQDGSLSFIPAAGSPDPTRSHFEAQALWEVGMPGRSNAARGWLNALAGLGGGSDRGPLAIGVGEANPRILSGPARVRLIPRGNAATREGVLANERTRRALLDLYEGQDDLSKAFRQGADSRMTSARDLTSETVMADNGAAPPAGLLLDARHIGVLMRADRRLRLGFLSAGGWDTHANQGAVAGMLARNLGNLALALVQLRQDFSEPGDVIVVASEFGRTCVENGTRGTDHGHGNSLWVIGRQVNGGRWHGLWSGLAQGALHDRRDLPVHHDFRSVLAEVLRAGFGLNDEQLQDIFPRAAFDAHLNGLMRAHA